MLSTVTPAFVLTEHLNNKSVYVDGIEEKEIVAVPPEPTVDEAISVIVFAIVMPPRFRIR